MVTADNITDDQIHQLATTLGDNFAALIALALSEMAVACPLCEVDAGTRCTNMKYTGYRAIRESHRERLAKRTEARAKCAEILNRRSK